MSNNFDQVCPSGNTMIDGFKEPDTDKIQCEICEDWFSELDEDDDGRFICTCCRENEADRQEAMRDEEADWKRDIRGGL